MKPISLVAPVVVVAFILAVASCGSPTETTPPPEPPVVSSVDPTSGPTAGGTVVTVTGSNFPSAATVTFGSSAAADVVIESSTLARATTPAHAEGTVDVTVTEPGGESATVSNAFTFVAPPILTSIVPDLGPEAGGTEVTLSGTGFQSGATVTFGGAAATGVTFNSATSLTATTPSGTAGAVDVVVTNPDTQSGTLAGGFTYVAPPTVASVAPPSGPTAGGTVVTITGTNFQSGATVTFGGAAATGVTFNSATSLTATTPPGTAGAADVVVTNPDTQSGTLAGGFTYVAPPTVASVAPPSAPTAGGTVVTITGTNFQSGATVTFGGAAATGVTFNSATSLTATTPSGAAGAADVVVTNPDTQTGTLAGGFTYVVVPAPTVGSVAPPSGPTAGGTVVTITGTDFQSGATVTVGGAAATSVTFNSATSLTATTPPGTAGAADVIVTNPDTQNGTLAGGFTYVAPPTVGSVAPPIGSTLGGTVVTITGTNFQSGATVTFGGAAATGVTFNSATSLTATTPPGAAGAADVIVTNPDTQNGTLAGGFTYVAPPTVGSVAPPIGSTLGGTVVTITGTNFQSGATVTFGGAAATGVTFNSATSLTATTPPGAAGAADVIVTNPDTQNGTLAGGFTYVAPPTVVSVAPASGPTAGGTVVTITGTDFQSGATVTVGGAAATGVTFNSATSITATTPPGTAGAADVGVTNPDTQTGTLAGGFTYVVVPAPTVGSVAPPSGPTAGGTVVTITGTNFQSGATVTFGGAAATSVTFNSATSITATTPPGTAGAADVGVTNPDTQTGTLAGGFTYVVVPAPTVGSVAPPSGPTVGGTVVTITGTNFQSGATVTFGGAAAPGVTFNSATSLTATTPPGTAGAADVVVTNPDTQSGTLAGGFTYVAPPTVASVAPPSGPTAGGTVVTITGTNFQSGATVTFGGAAATSVTFNSATSITATTPPGTAGAADVGVTNPDTQTGTLAGGFTYVVVPAPTVGSVAPPSGPTVGGTVVTITGTNFQSGATVTVGGAAATGVTFNSATSLTATTPPGAAGAVDVVVTNPDTQSGTLAGGFTYVVVPAPTVGSVAPPSGPTAGGTVVTITGTNFQSGATVTFGGAAATGVTFNSATSLTATTPSGTAGAVDVVVTNPDTQTGTLAGGFTYVAALTDGVPVTGLAASQGGEAFYVITVPAGAPRLEVVISGGTGDADLYVREGALPTTSVYDCRPFLVGNEETCTVTSPGSGDWFIMVRAFSAYSGVTLFATTAADADGDRLPDNVETNTGVFVSVLDTGTDPNNPDTDGDAIGDGDEVLGTLLGLDLPGLGVSPLIPNILIEYDWFDDSGHSHRPTATQIAMVTASFAAQGVDVIHDYGQGPAPFDRGNLIVDADGNVDGMGPEYYGYKAANFDANRNGYFHYNMHPHRYNNGNSSGLAEVGGDDFITATLTFYMIDLAVAGTIQHELGHNLNLLHGGNVGTNRKPNYNSIMSYNYQFGGVDNNCTPVADGVLDYSHGVNPPLDENNLDETLGICGGAPGWDWNQDGDALDAPVVADITRNWDPVGDGDGLFQVLFDYDDWSNLFYSGISDADGAAGGSRELVICQAPPDDLSRRR